MRSTWSSFTSSCADHATETHGRAASAILSACAVPRLTSGHSATGPHTGRTKWWIKKESNSQVPLIELSPAGDDGQTRLPCCRWNKHCSSSAQSMEHSKDVISVRLSKSDIAMIEGAAEQCGQSLAEFVRSAALRSAAEIADGRLVAMSPDGFSDFCLAISAPGVPIPEMAELANRPAPWESGHTTDK